MLLSNATASFERALAAVVPSSTPPRVWLDVGTSYKTLSKWDLLHNASLVVVGVDPVQANVESAQHPNTPRFVRVHGACAEGAPGFVTLNMHRSPTCGTLLPTRANAPSMGKGSSACTGDVPTPTRVPSFPLRQLLRKMEHGLARRVELLKIDVQGSELACLRSAGSELRRVDNVLLEVQDADEASGVLMYAGSPTLAQLDALLSEHNLHRQYCEANRWAEQAREINCLYASSHPAARRLWATGNEQPRGSIVSYDALPGAFVRPLRFAQALRTSSRAGARIGGLPRAGACDHPRDSARPPCVRPLDSRPP